MSSKVLVVGSGAIGLRTAVELLRRKIPIVLKSQYPPTHTSVCSMGAGGLWMPYKCDDPRVSGRWAIDTLDELLSFTTNGDGDGDGDGDDGPLPPLVEIVPTVYLTTTHQGPKVHDFIASNYNSTNDHNTTTTTTTKNDATDEGKNVNDNIVTPLPEWTRDPRIRFQHLTVEMLWWQNEVFRLRLPSQDTLFDAGYKYAHLFHPPVVDSPRMLKMMLSEIEAHHLTKDIDIHMAEEDNDQNTTVDSDNKKRSHYASIEEMVEDAKEYGCDTIINCTGFGASKLSCENGNLGDEDRDSSFVGGRGVLIQYDRYNCKRLFGNDDDSDDRKDVAITVEDGPWGSSTEPAYIIPRGDTLVVGGSYLEGDERVGLRDAERERLLKNASRLGIDTSKSNIIGEWTGFRPCRRPMVRLEVDDAFVKKDGVKVVHSYGHGGSGWTTFVGVAKETADLVQK